MTTRGSQPHTLEQAVADSSRAVRDRSFAANGPVDSSRDHVVLLDELGRPFGTALKSSVHHDQTPLHLAFSCYIVDRDGRVLLTRRAATKRTWPSVWTNTCCGHPRPGEPIASAVERHLRDELGVTPSRLECILPDFVYRAVMDNGIVEHELCPVYFATADTDVEPNPLELDAVEWISWEDLIQRCEHDPDSLSPWSAEQVREVATVVPDVLLWLNGPRLEPRRRPASTGQPGCDPFGPVGGAVEEALATFMAERCEELTALDPLMGEVCEQISSLIESGGKRLRPAFVHWGARSGGAMDAECAVHAAAAVEMLHTFALIHDDIMDRADVRRGEDSAHVRFTKIHRTTASSGDSAWFGTSAAVVAGDLAFVWADQLLDRLDCPIDIGRRVRSIFSLLRTEVITGQYLDIRLAGSPATRRQAATIALLKSGRYTVTRPLEIGAALAGVDWETSAALRRYGDAAGVAFQLRDDVLGVFGNPVVTGKSAVDDLRDGKASLLLVRAAELADASGRRVLADAVGQRDIDEEAADRCRDVVARSGALASIERLIESHTQRAEEAVQALPVPVRDALVALSTSMTARTA